MAGPMSSQGTEVYLSDSLTEKSASNITAANPAVITSTAHGQTTGDFIYVHDAGMPSLDDRVWLVGGANNDTLTLFGADASGDVASTIGKFDVATDILEVCVASFSRESPAPSNLDVTTLCDSERKNLQGMKNPGTWTANGFYESGDAGQNRLRDAREEGDKRLLVLVLPDGSRIAYVTQVGQLSESMGVDQPVQISTGGVLNSKVNYIAASP